MQFKSDIQEVGKLVKSRLYFFLNELNKAIKKQGGEKLSNIEEMEWMEVFESKKAEALKLKTEIENTDKEIDQMVYALYDLTEQEIAIVENS
jgi:predicted transcriptional regulator